MSHVEVVKLSEGTRPVLFMVHASGGVLTFARLARHLHPEQPCYLLKGRGIDTTRHPFRDIYHLAACYAEQIIEIQPQGPYMICGRQPETVIEVGQQLLRRGKTLSLTIVFDNGPPRHRPGAGEPKGLRRLLFRGRRTLSLAVSRLFGWMRAGLSGRGTTVDLTLWDRVRLERFAGKRSADRPKYINRDLFTDYVPTPYHSKVVFIQSLDQKRKKADYVDRWRTAADEVVYHTTPGGHSSMYELPHVHVLAHLVQRECDNVTNNWLSFDEREAL